MAKYSLLAEGIWGDWPKGYDDYSEMIKELKEKDCLTITDLDRVLGLFDAYINNTVYLVLDRAINSLSKKLEDLEQNPYSLRKDIEVKFEEKLKKIHREIEALKEVAGMHQEKLEMIEKDIDELWKEFKAYQIVREYSKERIRRFKDQVLRKVLELDNVKPAKVDAMLDVLIRDKEVPVSKFSDIAKDPRTLDKYVTLLEQTGYIEVLEKNGTKYLKLAEAP